MKILIADDHALFRDGLSLQLEKIVPDAVILQAGTYSQALKILEENKVDLAILDLDMPDMKWEEGLDAIQKNATGARFVVVSATEDIKSIRKVLDKGIAGYIPKRIETKILNGALKLILDGGTYLPPALLEGNSSSGNENKTRGKTLTNRQAEVLGFVAEGMSNKQIAFKMGVSEATVKLHINALLRSVGATNRTQAVIIAQKMGLI